MFEVELLVLDGRERLACDQIADVAHQPAAVAQPHLQPVEPALPFLHARLAAQAMFQKKEPAARFQDAMNFMKGPVHVIDAAQSKCADDTIEGAVGEWQPFAADRPLVDVDTGIPARRRASLFMPALGSTAVMWRIAGG